MHFQKNPKEVQLFKSDCEKLVERYNTLLKEISEYMKEHSKPNHEDPETQLLHYHITTQTLFFQFHQRRSGNSYK